MIDLSDLNTWQSIFFGVTWIVATAVGVYVFWTEINRD